MDIENLIEQCRGILNDGTDDFNSGYLEGILNVLEIFDSGDRCEACPFAYGTEKMSYYDGMEHVVECSLKKCWIELVKEHFTRQPDVGEKVIPVCSKIRECEDLPSVLKVCSQCEDKDNGKCPILNPME